MSNQPQGLRTPQRATFDIFDDEFDTRTQNTSNVYTPCTRLSRMTIESQSNGSQGRIRNVQYALPVSNFNEKLMEVVREEEEEQQHASTHPNLDMFLSADRISMFDKSKDNNQFFNEDSDEESDEGDLFSSSLCPMSSPERSVTRQSIFDDDTMASPPPINFLTRQSIFDDDDDENEEEEENHNRSDPIEEDEDYYDPSAAWLSQLYHDDTTVTSSLDSPSPFNSSEDNDEENRPPRIWHSRQDKVHEKKTRRTLPLEEDNTANERLPLREIRFEDCMSDDETPAKKKLNIGSGKSHKMRFMRTLSPPRYAKRKGRESAENIMPLSPSVV